VEIHLTYSCEEKTVGLKKKKKGNFFKVVLLVLFLLSLMVDGFISYCCLLSKGGKFCPYIFFIRLALYTVFGGAFVCYDAFFLYL
jgi:hypothetical protein